jgi:hypothetical protein
MKEDFAGAVNQLEAFIEPIFKDSNNKLHWNKESRKWEKK